MLRKIAQRTNSKSFQIQRRDLPGSPEGILVSRMSGCISFQGAQDKFSARTLRHGSCQKKMFLFKITWSIFWVCRVSASIGFQNAQKNCSAHQFEIIANSKTWFADYPKAFSVSRMSGCIGFLDARKKWSAPHHDTFFGRTIVFAGSPEAYFGSAEYLPL